MQVETDKAASGAGGSASGDSNGAPPGHPPEKTNGTCPFTSMSGSKTAEELKKTE